MAILDGPLGEQGARCLVGPLLGQCLNRVAAGELVVILDGPLGEQGGVASSGHFSANA